MTRLRKSNAAGLMVVMFSMAISAAAQNDDTAYLTWSVRAAQDTLKTVRKNGQVGGSFDLRVTHTEQSYNYKLRATWFTPEAIRAAARVVQLAQGLTDEQTKGLVDEVQHVPGLIVMIEIDPREGSGVIPLEWTALLRPRNAPDNQPGVKGESKPELRNLRVLNGAFRRDYDYDVFWMVFPRELAATHGLLTPNTREIELLVRIYNKEGRVRWDVPSSLVREAGR